MSMLFRPYFQTRFVDHKLMANEVFLENQFKDNMASEVLLNKFGVNFHSQNGEDGVIKEILKRLGLTKSDNYWCVEFGAWDGSHLSNTFSLVEKGWNAVYIEGDTVRYQELLQTSKSFLKITPINAIVNRRSGRKTSLDNLLADTKIQKDFELMSIDIDSFDYSVWKSLKNYSPKIVVIEINSSVRPGIFWQHGYKTPGNTFSQVVRLGVHKGYKLVCHTGNLIFVRNDLIGKLNFPEKFISSPELLFMNSWIRKDLYNYCWLGTGRVLKVNGILRFILRKVFCSSK